MTIIGFIVVWTVLWWLIFFMVLPIGVETESKPQTGNASSAPKEPRIFRKMLVATVISLALTSVFFYALDMEWIQLRPEEIT